MSQGRTRNGHDRVLAVIQENAASLLRLARRHSICADDAHDAYQRTLEIYLRKLDDIDDATAGQYLRTVVKHEAMAIRRQRQRFVGGEEVDLDTWVSPAESGEERVLGFDRMARAAEALQSCKRDEVSAMILKAEGHSYAEISAITGFSYTKVNRCLAEGRARFLKRFAAIEAGEECDRVAPVLSAIVDGEASEKELAAARPHLRNCPACRAVLRQLHESEPVIHSVLPIGAVVVAAGAEPAAGAGWLERAWEAVFGSAQSAGLKVQAAIETAASAKGAAVAASAVALAGGGAVAMEGAAQTPERPARQVAAVAARPVAEPSTGPPAVPAARAGGQTLAMGTAAAAAVAGEEAAPSSDDSEERRERTQRQEFGFETASAPSRDSAASASPAPAPAGDDSTTEAAPDPPRTESFGFER